MRAHAGWGKREKAARGRVPARAVTCPYVPQLYAEPFYVCFQKSFFFFLLTLSTPRSKQASIQLM